MISISRWIRIWAFGVLTFMTAAAAAGDTIPPEDRYAEVNGVRLHYVAAGQGPLILFLHGFPEFWYQWKDQLSEFARDHRVVAPDMRGFNLSSRPADIADYSGPKLIEDVRALAEHLGYRKFILVGHDWGGLVAWAFAMKHPDRLEKLIILNAPHPGVFERELRENPAQQQASQYMLLFNSADAERVIGDQDFGMLVEHVLGDGLAKGYVSEEDRKRYLDVWRDGGTVTAGLNYYRAARLGPPPSPGDYWIPEKHYVPKLGGYRVKVPTLLLWGVQDRYLLPGVISGLSRYVPDMKVKLYPDAGHWLNRTKAFEVNRDIRRFLSGTPLDDK